MVSAVAGNCECRFQLVWPVADAVQSPVWSCRIVRESLGSRLRRSANGHGHARIVS